MFTMGGMWCLVIVAERGGSSSPFMGDVVNHCQRWWGDGGPSWVLVMGCVRRTWRCWWAIVGVGDGTLLALVGCGAGHHWR